MKIFSKNTWGVDVNNAWPLTCKASKKNRVTSLDFGIWLCIVGGTESVCGFPTANKRSIKLETAVTWSKSNLNMINIYQKSIINFWIWKAGIPGENHRPWIVRSNDLTHWATRAPENRRNRGKTDTRIMYNVYIVTWLLTDTHNTYAS